MTTKPCPECAGAGEIPVEIGGAIRQTHCMLCRGRGEVPVCGKCGEIAEFENYCGCYVCGSCGNHLGLARCYCGWAADGGNGRAQLVECGEVIDEEE